jgi:VRR-NUC domain
VKKPRETELVRTLLDYLHLIKGALAWRQNSGAAVFGEGSQRRFVRMNTAAGCSDIIGIMPDGSGRLLAVEVKMPGKQPTPMQAAFLDQVNSAGGCAFVAHSIGELDMELNNRWGNSSQRRP